MADVNIASVYSERRTPRLRSDLVLSLQDGAVVVKDPRTRRFFKFGPAEHFIATQLDGTTPVDIVHERLQSHLGSRLDAAAINRFVASLERLGLLETEMTAAQLPARRPRMWQGNPLFFRLRAFDPDRLLDRLIPKVRGCFTASFVMVSAVAIVTALGIAISDWPEITRDLQHLYRPEVLFVAWVAIFAVTTLHEFAHGLTCKHFGGHVHEMGFLLIYFQLAFYCNVSDAWLFAQKSRRLWVTAAGPYFELLIWALAVFAWRVTEPGTLPNIVALVIVATSAFKLFINLNPLIKLDGYYLLSDAVGIANLRARAFGYLQCRLGQLFGSGRPLSPVTPRERLIYLCYGALAGGYSAWLIGYITWAFGGYLTTRYQGTGAIMYSALLLVFFQHPLRRALSRRELVRAVSVRWSSLKRPVRWVLLLGLLTAVFFLGRWELTASGEFAIAPLHNTDIRASVDGLVEEVLVDEGHLVKPGDLVARLAQRDYRAELRRVIAERNEKRAKLKMLRVGPRVEEIEVARRNLDTARTKREHAARRYDEARRLHEARLARVTTDLGWADERVKYARNDIERSRALFGRELISRSALDEAEERIAIREKEREAAQAELDRVRAEDLSDVQRDVAVATTEAEEALGKLNLLRAGNRAEEIEATEAEVARLDGQRQHLEEQLGLTNIVSPVGGIVTTAKPKELVGRYLSKGDFLVEVNELKTINAEIAVPESEIGEVKIGQLVVLRTRAFPGTTFAGAVSAIAPVGVKEEEAWRGKVFRVTTVIDNSGLLLRPGMTGNAKVACGGRSLFDLVTRRLARYLRVEFWSWW
jgi:putative peptide zinc metalloprotease protein